MQWHIHWITYACYHLIFEKNSQNRFRGVYFYYIFPIHFCGFNDCRENMWHVRYLYFFSDNTISMVFFTIFYIRLQTNFFLFTLHKKIFITLMIVYDIMKFFDRPPMCCPYFQINKSDNNCSGKNPSHSKSKHYNY